MIIMRVCLDNFMSFNNFDVKMTYPRKIRNAYLRDEHLEGYPNFRYKKALIIMGANASGKTTFGRMLCKIFNFIGRQNIATLIEAIGDENKEASFLIDFIPSTTEKKRLFRVETIISVGPNEEPPVVKARVKSVLLKADDSYEKAEIRLTNMDAEYEDTYASLLRSIPKIGYYFSFEDQEDMASVSKKADDEEYRKILELVLKTLDPAIEEVNSIEGYKESFNIIMHGRKNVLVQDGEFVNKNLLSAGTKAGLFIADIFSAMHSHNYGFFYIDEKFSYIQTDVEKAAFSIMSSELNDCEQLIFTTHNIDMVDLPLPKHTYMFLKKSVHDETSYVVPVYPEDYLKKDSASMRNAIENDLFCTIPNLERLFEVMAE